MKVGIKQLNYFKNKIKAELDLMRNDIGELRYNLYIQMVDGCDNYYELLELSELEMQIQFIKYTNDNITNKLKESDTTVRDLKEAIDSELPAYLDEPIETDEAYETFEDFNEMSEEEQDEFLAAMARNISARIDNEPEEEKNRDYDYMPGMDVNERLEQQYEDDELERFISGDENPEYNEDDEYDLDDDDEYDLDDEEDEEELEELLGDSDEDEFSSFEDDDEDDEYLTDEEELENILGEDYDDYEGEDEDLEGGDSDASDENDSSLDDDFFFDDEEAEDADDEDDDDEVDAELEDFFSDDEDYEEESEESEEIDESNFFDEDEDDEEESEDSEEIDESDFFTGEDEEEDLGDLFGDEDEDESDNEDDEEDLSDLSDLISDEDDEDDGDDDEDDMDLGDLISEDEEEDDLDDLFITEDNGGNPNYRPKVKNNINTDVSIDFGRVNKTVFKDAGTQSAFNILRGVTDRAENKLHQTTNNMRKKSNKNK